MRAGVPSNVDEDQEQCHFACCAERVCLIYMLLLITGGVGGAAGQILSS